MSQPVTAEIRNADCTDLAIGLPSLGDLSIDVAIFDPPYSEHTHRAGRRGSIEAEPGTGRACFNRNRDLGFEHLTAELRLNVAREMARVVRRWVLVFSDMESHHLWSRDLVAAGLQHVRVGIWHKRGCTPQFTGDRPAQAAEAIVIAHRPGRKRWNGGGTHAFWDTPIVLNRAANGARLHTTQKPLELMEALVRDFSEPDELVIDPFCGSGTTGEACRRLGRRFLGWEKNGIYAEVAQRRIDGSGVARPSGQLGLFLAERTR